MRRWAIIFALILVTPLWAGRSFSGLDATITAVSTTGGTATFTATNSFTAGLTTYIQGLTGGCTSLNGTVVTILNTGLTGSAFEATVSGTPSCSGQSGNASANLILANGISTPLDISTGNETVSFWWYPTSTATQCAVCHYIFSTSGGQFAVGIAYGTGSAGQLTWAVGCCGSITGTSYGNCPTAVTLNHWYQIILYSISGSATGLIVNGGSFCNSSTGWDSANISAGGTNFTIGGQGNGLYPASGIIAEVAVWPSNLTAGFKQALATICPVGPSARRMGLPKPAGYFPLYGASGSLTEPDLSGNVLNGAMGGPPSTAIHAPCTP